MFPEAGSVPGIRSISWVRSWAQRPGGRPCRGQARRSGERVFHSFSGSLSTQSFLKRHRAGTNNHGYPIKISEEIALVWGDRSGGLEAGNWPQQLLLECSSVLRLTVTHVPPPPHMMSPLTSYLLTGQSPFTPQITESPRLQRNMVKLPLYSKSAGVWRSSCFNSGNPEAFALQPKS